MASSLEGVAVVTGGNKGVGLAIVRGLCKQFKGHVLLTARNEENGKSAVELLKTEGLNPIYEQLDILSNESIDKFKSRIEKNYGGIDILVNNAGIAYKRASTSPLIEKAHVTLQTNLFATLAVTNTLLPHMRNGSHICMVSSMTSKLKNVSQDKDHPVRQRLIDPSLTEEGVLSLMREYLIAVDNNDYSIWPKDSPYSLSKVAITAVTRAIGRKLANDPRGIIINACCPGYVDTDMTSHRGVLTPDQGAVTPLMMCFIPSKGSNGEFYMEEKMYDWLNSD
ncbi:hypothetical protein LOD99_11599 [Oopsacas minuta]|uniref:carbonyl reductase (NADPH) n=1 Tax=Oopsacas minuta TaxID=111878 RepID=A0AAV7JJW2_9METZ|nr:hypothetical protein LOD99_11599 [Oopsacas minuta]